MYKKIKWYNKWKDYNGKTYEKKYIIIMKVIDCVYQTKSVLIVFFLSIFYFVCIVNNLLRQRSEFTQETPLIA